MSTSQTSKVWASDTSSKNVERLFVMQTVWNANPTIDAFIGGIDFATLESVLHLPLSLFHPIRLFHFAVCFVNSRRRNGIN